MTKGKKIDGVYQVLSVFSRHAEANVRMMQVHPTDAELKPLTFCVANDRVFTPKRRRGEKFKVIYSVIAEMEF